MTQARPPTATIERLDADDYAAAIDQLADLVIDAVASGAGVNFLDGVTHDEAAAWWRARTRSILEGTSTLFVAVEGEGRIVGSTLLIRSVNANSPHRAEIGKVLVHRQSRRQGLGRRLMEAAESAARDDGRWLLILDTVTGSAADALYRSMGWHEVGVIPDHSYRPDGVLASTTYFWKDLR